MIKAMLIASILVASVVCYSTDANAYSRGNNIFQAFGNFLNDLGWHHRYHYYRHHYHFKVVRRSAAKKVPTDHNDDICNPQIPHNEKGEYCSLCPC